MYKTSIDLGRINPSLKVTFNLIIKGDKLSERDKHIPETIDKFKFHGATYLKFSPKAFITLDISKTGDKGDGWNPNTSANLNKIALFEFVKKCELILNAFKVKELFYINNRKLKVSLDIAKKLAQRSRAGNKTVAMIHAVVIDDEHPETEYEGVSLMINTMDNFALLTYSELQYLHHLLSTVNMDVLSMQLINAYLTLESNDKSLSTTREITIDRSISEIKTEEKDINPLPKAETGHEIPNI